MAVSCKYEESDKMARKLVCATRVHSVSIEKPIDMERLKRFCEMASSYSDVVLIGMEKINGNNENVMKLYHAVEVLVEEYSKVCVLEISPWMGFSIPLNVMLEYAAKQDCTHVMYQSLEMKISTTHVQSMMGHWDENVLVIGAELAGHVFEVGTHVLSGRRCPWNTVAIWSVEKLAKTGFLTISDGVHAKTKGCAGIEEVSVISLLQHIDGSSNRAILLRCSGMEWDTNWHHIDRIQYHEAKMNSKDTRSATQLHVLGIPYGNVEHRLPV